MENEYVFIKKKTRYTMASGGVTPPHRPTMHAQEETTHEYYLHTLNVRL